MSAINLGSDGPQTEAGVIAKLAEHAAARHLIEIVPGRRVGLVLGEGQRFAEIDLEGLLDNPHRKTGHPTVTDADSFIDYVGRHKAELCTTLWSNVDDGTVTAVIDDHAKTAGDDEGWAQWGEHRATFKLTETPDWLHWLGKDGKLIGQQEFAEHLEDGSTAILRPAAADMLEIAQSFQAKTGVEFKAASRLASGEVKLQYEETVAARAGVKGDIEVPEMFRLQLQPFEGAGLYEIDARFRYRIGGGQLTLGYKLVRPDLVRKAAFVELSGAISDALGLPVLAGVPRS